MKENLLNYLSRHYYPQTVFVSSINKFIDPQKSGILIDAPCGNGETSRGFALHKNLKVLGYDIDAKSINVAKGRYTSENLHFETADIFSAISRHTNVDYFCIINSLFLLPQPEKIIETVKNILSENGLLFIILPNVNGKNFKWFSDTNTGENKLILKPEEFQSYFNKNGMNLKSVEPIAFTHNYGRKDVKLFSVFSHFYLRFLNSIRSLFKIGNPNYFLLVLQK